MIRVASWEVEAGGRSFKFNPLRVRERIRLADALAEERAKAASADALLVGMGKEMAAAHVGAERRRAMGAQQLLLDCYSTRGALRVLAESCGGEEAIAFANAAEPDIVTRTALEALGLDMEARGEAASGNG